jgi:hypothetical protein
MALAKARAAQRANVGALDGFFCYLCGVPSAATIEHVQARHHGGHSLVENLKIACCYCNSRKAEMPVEEFMERQLWRLERPPELPPSVRAMAEACFGWVPAQTEQEVIASGVKRAKLVLQNGKVAAVVRPSERHPWTPLILGAEDDSRVVAACWDFLYRHNLRAPKPSRARARVK